MKDPCTDGRPNLLTQYRSTIPSLTMFFGAAIHGWEWENAYGLLRLAEVLCEDPMVERLDTGKFHYKIVPDTESWRIRQIYASKCKRRGLEPQFRL